MALSKVNFNSMNVTPAASKAIKFNSSNNGLETGDIGGSLVLISEQTASGVQTLSFTSGIDSTYKEYIFKCFDINPGTDDQVFRIKFSIDGGSNYNATVTSTSFYALHREDGSTASLQYHTSMDEAQGTSGQQIARSIGNGSDESFCATVHLFDPSNTTFVKHFISRGNEYQSTNDESRDYNIAGYVNSTSAVNAVQFLIGGGVFDGTIKMYGVL
jgi:hypothetical protein